MTTEGDIMITLTEKPHIVIQGEGPNVNKKMIVLRFSGCDVKCPSCDSKHTWQKDSDGVIPGFKYSVSELKREVTGMIEKHQIDCIMLTGGEPMLQKVDIVDFMEAMKAKPLGIKRPLMYEIETAGHHSWRPWFRKHVVDMHINFSPKIGSLTPSAKDLDYIGIAEAVTSYIPRYSVKIVIDPSDESVIETIKNFRIDYNIPRYNIYLMPLGATREEIIKNSVLVEELAIKYNYQFTSRQHILIHDNKKLV